MASQASVEDAAPAGPAIEVDSPHWYELSLTCEGLQPYAHTSLAFRDQNADLPSRELCNPCVVVERKTR
jgi:hypothetical protein